MDDYSGKGAVFRGMIQGLLEQGVPPLVLVDALAAELEPVDPKLAVALQRLVCKLA
ncbi:MAG: hypothetical protein AB1896_23545 [Thermodesulfobacteriota bacterium]